MTSDPYTVPAGLDSVEFRAALAEHHPEITDRHYLANGALTHVYLDRRRARSVRVAETLTSPYGEIVGDMQLWLCLRDLAVWVQALREAAAADTAHGREVTA